MSPGWELHVMARALIGTSGWAYKSWRERFYPANLPSRRYLEFYGREFPTTELNASFYRLPSPQTFRNWANQVPDRFVFAVKASRLLTHIKRLIDVEEPWTALLKSACELEHRLGPILLQLPPSFRLELTRLEAFLEMVQGGSAQAALRLVFEFRHQSWFRKEVYRLLERYGAALCIADSPRYPREDVVTADFAYFRYHGRSQLFASNYSRVELTREARKIEQYLQDGVEVFAYFNNDARGYAVQNAHTLKMLLKA